MLRRAPCRVPRLRNANMTRMTAGSAGGAQQHAANHKVGRVLLGAAGPVDTLRLNGAGRGLGE
jgi:hypothetical protein